MERTQDLVTPRAVVGVLTLVVVALLASVSVARAAHMDNAICRPFTLNGQKIDWEVIGTWTCAKAKQWIIRLDGDHATTQLGKVPLHNGPRGYHCFATRVIAKGRVVDGLCYQGTLAYPKSGFTW